MFIQPGTKYCYIPEGHSVKQVSKKRPCCRIMQTLRGREGERERERYIYIYIYIYTHMNRKNPQFSSELPRESTEIELESHEIEMIHLKVG